MKYFKKLADKTNYMKNPGGGSFDAPQSRTLNIAEPYNKTIKNVDADKKTFDDMILKHQDSMRTSTGDSTWVMPKNESAMLDSLNASANYPNIQMLTEENKKKWNDKRSKKTTKGTSHESTAFMNFGSAATDTLYLNPKSLLPTYKAEVSHTIDKQRNELSGDEAGNKTSNEFKQFGYDVYNSKSGGGASEDITHNKIEHEVDDKHNAAKNRDRVDKILKMKQDDLDIERSDKKTKWLDENPKHKYHPKQLNKESKLKYF